MGTRGERFRGDQAEAYLDGSPSPAPDGLDRAEHVQVWFGPEERPLFGWLSLPAGGRARGAVVLCLPMGEEGRSAHRTFRTLAEALADVGLAALRFDYDGTGDSAGAQQDPDRVGAWLASIEAARDYLTSLGATDVAAVGMRLGATLAAFQVAHSGHGFSSLVLWDPCVSGRTFLREGEALHQFGEGGEAGGTPEDGLRHTPGFQYDAATAAALRGIDLAKLPDTVPLARRVLLLNRSDRPASPAIGGRLAREGDRLESGVAHDQDRLLDLAPSDNFVPRRAVADVVSWLEHGVLDAAPVTLTAPVPRSVVVPSAGAAAESTPVRERGIALGEAGLFGVVSEPLAAPAAGDHDVRPWVVLVNVAAEHHIGPGRRWVEYAREWAALGYRCVRMDQSGIGDSPLRPGQLEDAPFAPEWLDDMPQVIAHLSAGGAPVIMVGLCSGAYSSFEAALAAPVDSVLAVNPRLTLWPAAKGTPVYTTRRRAGALPARPLAVLAGRRRILAGALWRIYREIAVWHAPFRFVRRVVRRGTYVELIACQDDAQHFYEVLAWRPSMRLLLRSGRLRFEETQLDHSLLGRSSQELIRQRAADFLRRRHEELAR